MKTNNLLVILLLGIMALFITAANALEPLNLRKHTPQTKLLTVEPASSGSYLVAGIYWLPDYLKGNLDRNGNEDPDKTGKCGEYGFLDNKPDSSLYDFDTKYNVTKLPDDNWLTCYANVRCKSSFTYNSLNCKAPKTVSGISCGGKYNACVCQSKYIYSSANCPSPKTVSGSSCEGKFESCICPAKYTYTSADCPSPKVLSGTSCDGKYESCICPAAYKYTDSICASEHNSSWTASGTSCNGKKNACSCTKPTCSTGITGTCENGVQSTVADSCGNMNCKICKPKCSAEFKYDSTNCPPATHNLGGNSCDGKYNQCTPKCSNTCNSGYTLYPSYCIYGTSSTYYNSCHNMCYACAAKVCNISNLPTIYVSSCDDLKNIYGDAHVIFNNSLTCSDSQLKQSNGRISFTGGWLEGKGINSTKLNIALTSFSDCTKISNLSWENHYLSAKGRLTLDNVTNITGLNMYDQTETYTQYATLNLSGTIISGYINGTNYANTSSLNISNANYIGGPIFNFQQGSIKNSKMDITNTKFLNLNSSLSIPNGSISNSNITIRDDSSIKPFETLLFWALNISSVSNNSTLKINSFGSVAFNSFDASSTLIYNPHENPTWKPGYIGGKYPHFNITMSGTAFVNYTATETRDEFLSEVKIPFPGVLRLRAVPSLDIPEANGQRRIYINTGGGKIITDSSAYSVHTDTHGKGWLASPLSEPIPPMPDFNF